LNARYRPACFALVAVLAVWVAALAGYALSNHFKMTAEKLRAYLSGKDLSRMSAAERAKALRDLADKINALSPEDRQQARLARLWSKWFEEMTEGEKAQFLDATLPSGFKQMLASFEQQPADKRRKAIDNAIKNLQDSRDKSPQSADSSNPANANQPTVLSEDLQKRVVMIGLGSVYSDSSAQTKAELAPLLEEIQRSMENGRLFRGGR
jgi:hypothetical protein